MEVERIVEKEVERLVVDPALIERADRAEQELAEALAMLEEAKNQEPVVVERIVEVPTDKIIEIERIVEIEKPIEVIKEVEVINGFRTRTVFEDAVLQTGYNIDKYNQMGRQMASYYLDMDRPEYYSVPMNTQMYSYTNTPNNLYMNNEQQIAERAGTYHAENFSSRY